MVSRAKLLFYVIPLVLISNTSLAEDNWIETARENNCVFYKGKIKNGITPIRAVCDWEHINPSKLNALLQEAADYDKYFSGLASCDPADPVDGINRVLQIHKYTGLTARAAFIEFQQQEIPNGKRYTYTKSKDQTKLKKEFVEIKTHTGHWDVIRRKLGSRLIFESRYSAGGAVPNFLIRWFQGAGTRKVVADLKKYVEGQKK